MRHSWKDRSSVNHTRSLAIPRVQVYKDSITRYHILNGAFLNEDVIRLTILGSFHPSPVTLQRTSRQMERPLSVSVTSLRPTTSTTLCSSSLLLRKYCLVRFILVRSFESGKGTSEREREGKREREREEEKVDRGDIGAVTLSDTEFGRTTSRVYTRWIYTRRYLSRFSTTCTSRVHRVYTNVYTTCASIYTRRQGSQVSLGPHWHNTFTDVTLHSKLLRCHTRIPPPPPPPLLPPARNAVILGDGNDALVTDVHRIDTFAQNNTFFFPSFFF